MPPSVAFGAYACTAISHSLFHHRELRWFCELLEAQRVSDANPWPRTLDRGVAFLAAGEELQAVQRGSVLRSLASSSRRHCSPAARRLRQPPCSTSAACSAPSAAVTMLGDKERLVVSSQPDGTVEWRVERPVFAPADIPPCLILGGLAAYVSVCITFSPASHASAGKGAAC